MTSFLTTTPTSSRRASFHDTSINMSAAASRLARSSVGKITPQTSIFFLCDIQDRFRPLMYNGETIVTTAQYLTSMASELSVPVVASQQYTKVFGKTVTDCFANGQQDIDKLVAQGQLFEKKKFSMMTDEVQALIETDDFKNRNSIVLFGIEAHVCVQQTCLDLLEMGKEVHVICDGVSSQQPFDREIALERMASAGAYLTTAQSLAFMLMQTADHPNFKAVSKLTVNHMKLPNAFNDAYKK